MKKRSRLDLASGVHSDKSQAAGLTVEHAPETPPEREKPGSRSSGSGHQSVAAATADQQRSPRVLIVATVTVFAVASLLFFALKRR